VSERLTIGELARRAHTTTKTVRYYERIGLLPLAERGDNSYRYYGEGQVHQLRFIRRAQRLGLTLAEIAQLIGLARDARCNDLRTELDTLFTRKIRDYELKIAALKTLQRRLQPEGDACACRAFVPDCGCLPAGETGDTDEHDGTDSAPDAGERDDLAVA
jgi:DNA-binding transcriptional MerR regulator